MKTSSIQKQDLEFPGAQSTAHFNSFLSTDGLYVQSIDIYGFQRELTVRPSLDAGEYEVHSYIHPGIRSRQFVSRYVALHFIERFRELITKHPDLYFNATKTEPVFLARNDGFVRLHTRLISGERFSVNLIG